jgi:hypothetical protein
VRLQGATAAVGVDTLAFLSVSWGAIADIDLEADFLRRLCGRRRWELWQRWRLAHPRRYRSVLEYHEQGGGGGGGGDSGGGGGWTRRPLVFSYPYGGRGGGWTRLPGEDWVLLWACNAVLMTTDFGPAPGALLDDGLWHIAIGPSSGVPGGGGAGADGA